MPAQFSELVKYLLEHVNEGIDDKIEMALDRANAILYKSTSDCNNSDEKVSYKYVAYCTIIFCTMSYSRINMSFSHSKYHQKIV